MLSAFTGLLRSAVYEETFEIYPRVMNSTEFNISQISLGSGNDDTRKVTKVIFSLTACFALIGNVLVLILFIRCPIWLKKTHNQCIFSLAVTDILTAISLFVVPKFLHDSDAYTVPSSYLAREMYCPLVWSPFIPFSFGITSVYTCFVFALELCLSFVRPF